MLAALTAALLLTQTPTVSTIKSNETVTANGQFAIPAPITGQGELSWTVGTISSGGSITFNWYNIDPQSGLQVGPTYTSGAVSASSTNGVVLGPITTGSAMATWTVAGSSPSIANTYLTFTYGDGVTNAYITPAYVDAGFVESNTGFFAASGCYTTPAGCQVCDDGTNLHLKPLAGGVTIAERGLWTDGGLGAVAYCSATGTGCLTPGTASSGTSIQAPTNQCIYLDPDGGAAGAGPNASSFCGQSAYIATPLSVDGGLTVGGSTTSLGNLVAPCFWLSPSDATVCTDSSGDILLTPDGGSVKAAGAVSANGLIATPLATAPAPTLISQTSGASTIYYAETGQTLAGEGIVGATLTVSSATYPTVVSPVAIAGALAGHYSIYRCSSSPCSYMGDIGGNTGLVSGCSGLAAGASCSDSGGTLGTNSPGFDFADQLCVGPSCNAAFVARADGTVYLLSNNGVAFELESSNGMVYVRSNLSALASLQVGTTSNLIGAVTADSTLQAAGPVTVGSAAVIAVSGGATPTIGTDGGPIVLEPATDVQIGVGGSTNDAVTVTPGAALSDVVTFDATGVDSSIAFQFNTKGAGGFFVNDYIFASGYEGATPGTAAVDPYGATLGGHSSNYVEVAGANAGSYPTITVAGSDADGGLEIAVPGYGGVDFTPLGSGASPDFIGSTALGAAGDSYLALGESHATVTLDNFTLGTSNGSTILQAANATGGIYGKIDGGVEWTVTTSANTVVPLIKATGGVQVGTATGDNPITHVHFLAGYMAAQAVAAGTVFSAGFTSSVTACGSSCSANCICTSANCCGGVAGVTTANLASSVANAVAGITTGDTCTLGAASIRAGNLMLKADPEFQGIEIEAINPTAASINTVAGTWTVECHTH